MSGDSPRIACSTSSAFDAQRRFRLDLPTPDRTATNRTLRSSQPTSTSNSRVTASTRSSIDVSRGRPVIPRFNRMAAQVASATWATANTIRRHA